MSQGQPEGRPEPYWRSPEDWYEFYRFRCPGCSLEYVIDRGSAFRLEARPRPIVLTSRWDLSAAPIGFAATIVCPCLVKFDVAHGRPVAPRSAPAGDEPGTLTASDEAGS